MNKYVKPIMDISYFDVEILTVASTPTQTVEQWSQMNLQSQLDTKKKEDFKDIVAFSM